MSTLHPRLAADTRAIAENTFAWVRYLNDQRFAWLVVVPKQSDLREWHAMVPVDQSRLLTLVNGLARSLQAVTGAAKMNLGALGNLVPQLHIHVIARNPGDACWPGPVWGNGQVEPYAVAATPAWLTPLIHLIDTEKLLHE